jgi:hypothetical protein
MKNVLGYLKLPQEALYEAFRLAKPGAKIYIENMNWGYAGDECGGKGLHSWVVIGMLYEAGFTSIKLRTPHHVLWPFGNFIIEAKHP